MPAYRDKRDGRWRYRKWVALPNGTRIRVTGTSATDTKIAAEAAERTHIDRVLHPKHDKRHSVPLSPALLAALAALPKRGLWVLAQEDGEPMNYERMLEGIHALYELAGQPCPRDTLPGVGGSAGVLVRGEDPYQVSSEEWLIPVRPAESRQR